jgi:methionine-gamma-lyase
MADDVSGKGFSTRAIHTARYQVPGRTSPVAYPLFQTASFAFDSAEDEAETVTGGRRDFFYSRVGNPTTEALHETIAALEGAEAAVSFASGIGAIHAAMIATLKAGDHILCTDRVYGGTYTLVTHVLPRFGITHSFVDMTDPAAVARAIRPETRLLWGETISNPTTVVLDLAALAELAHAHGALFAVDSTFTSPYLCRPLEQGVDLVIHSATKYIGGHGDLSAGIVLGSREQLRQVQTLRAETGGAAAPLEAWLMLRGLKTLALRMDRHCANAMALAAMLASHPGVERVHYPGLPSHPQHMLARERLRDFGAVVSFQVPGGRAAAYRVIDRLRLALRASSLGDADTLVLHPATVSHRRLSAEVRATQGVTDGLIRVSVGLEDPEDILDDFRQALSQS